MSETTYAIVTPSYWMDVERCRFLLETTERWTPPWLHHYLIISKRDLSLFRPMLNSRRTLIVVEDIIPNWLFRLPGFRRFWFSLQTRPVKNWILQQIVKLSAPLVIKEDILLYADSDLFFISPFDPRSFERDNRVPLFVETGQKGLIPFNGEWQETCCRLLGIPGSGNDDNNYIGQLIWWRRQNALEAVHRVQEVTGKDWQKSIAPLSGFSEYILYGLYSQCILTHERSGHWIDTKTRTLSYWKTTPLNPQELLQFKGEREEHHHSAMISAKSGTRLSDIRDVFFSG